MLVQKRSDGRLRLFRQHHHALVSGELAAAWIGPARDPSPLPFALVLAIALHDLAWIPLDARPRLDPKSGRPVSFHRFPAPEKARAYARGLDRLSALHPYGGLLGSLHYASFPDVAGEEAFQSAERERRRRLRAELALGAPEEERVRRHLAFLRLFDRLSLFLCLTPPAAEPTGRPEWVEAARHAEVPEGPSVHFTWVDEEVVHADPFPFRGRVELRLSYRELGGGRFDGQEELERAWETAPERTWWVEVREPLRLA